MSGKPDDVKILCFLCKQETNHKVIAQHQLTGHNGYVGRWWENFEILQCLGCESITFRHVFSSEDDLNHNTGEMDEHVTLYPDRKIERIPIEEFRKFPPKTKKIYLESIKAINGNLPLLTAIGLRALIEAICIEQNTATGNLKTSINGLRDNGFLSVKQSEILHSLRFLGNVAAHEIEAAHPKELIAALEIAETMLKSIYVLEDLHASIKTGNKIPSV